jgi:uncharacterized protein YbaP (TraB family)
MKKFPFNYRFLLVLALVGGTTSLSQAGTCDVWRLTNGKAPFYIAGTIHALSGTVYPLGAGYDQAVRDSKRIIFEMAPNPDSDFGKRFGLAAAYPKGDTIQRHVHPQTWAYLQKNFQISSFFKYSFDVDGISIGTVDHLRPWGIVWFVWGTSGWTDITSAHGVENYLHHQGKMRGAEFGGMESETEHLNVMSGMNDQESELMLLYALTRGDKRKADDEKYVAAWKRGDMATMWAEDQRERNVNPGGMARLVDMRNVKWIPRIRSEINGGVPTTIAVGAAHLNGPNGVIALLQRNGYKFEQL